MSQLFTPSANVRALRESATIAVSMRARELKASGRRIIDLGVGEPDFPTPPHIIEAATRALAAGATRYTPVPGIPALRDAVARHTAGPRVTPAEVVVGCGAKQALFQTCYVLFSEGDEVLVPTPGWTSYYEMLTIARATPVAVLGDASNGFRVGADDLERAATPRTRGLMLNSPSNPTGTVYSAEALRDLLQLAARHGWWVISDEIYRRLSYDGEAVSARAIAETCERLVVVDGVSKAYAMTGWRIGWAVAPRPVADAVAALQSHLTSNAAAVSQHAALAALEDREASERSITAMVSELRHRRDALMARMARLPGMDVVRPEGAFYLFVRVDEALPDAEDAGSVFAARLLEEDGVAVVPGAAFGAPAWVRLSYAAPLPVVMEGVERMAALHALLRDGATVA